MAKYNCHVEVKGDKKLKLGKNGTFMVPGIILVNSPMSFFFHLYNH